MSITHYPHIIWKDEENGFFVIRCGHIEVPLTKKPHYCPVCGENVEDDEIREEKSS